MVHQQNYHPSNMNQNRNRSGANSNSSGIPVKRNPNSKNVIQQQQQDNNVKNVNQVKKSSNVVASSSSRKLQRRSSVTSTEWVMKKSIKILPQNKVIVRFMPLKSMRKTLIEKKRTSECNDPLFFLQMLWSSSRNLKIKTGDLNNTQS